MISSVNRLGAVAAALLFSLAAIGCGAAQTATDETEAPPHSEPLDRDGPLTDAFSMEDEAAIRAIVRDYIEANPEFVLDALNAFIAGEQEREQIALEERTRDYLPALTSADGAYIAGAEAGAKVAVVEFFDYHCGYCKKASGMMRKLAAADPEVQVIFRELPILREESDLAAQYALAARDQGKYTDFHFAMLGSSGVLSEARIIEIADKVGLDTKTLKRMVKNGDAIRESIEANRTMARDLQLDGTPSFVVASMTGDYLKVVPGLSEAAVTEAIKEAKAAQ